MVALTVVVFAACRAEAQSLTTTNCADVEALSRDPTFARAAPREPLVILDVDHYVGGSVQLINCHFRSFSLQVTNGRRADNRINLVIRNTTWINGSITVAVPYGVVAVDIAVADSFLACAGAAATMVLDDAKFPVGLSGCHTLTTFVASNLTQLTISVSHSTLEASTEECLLATNESRAAFTLAVIGSSPLIANYNPLRLRTLPWKVENVAIHLVNSTLRAAAMRGDCLGDPVAALAVAGVALSVFDVTSIANLTVGLDANSRVDLGCSSRAASPNGALMCRCLYIAAENAVSDLHVATAGRVAAAVRSPVVMGGDVSVFHVEAPTVIRARLISEAGQFEVTVAPPNSSFTRVSFVTSVMAIRTSRAAVLRDVSLNASHGTAISVQVSTEAAVLSVVQSDEGSLTIDRLSMALVGTVVEMDVASEAVTVVSMRFAKSLANLSVRGVEMSLGAETVVAVESSTASAALDKLAPWHLLAVCAMIFEQPTYMAVEATLEGASLTIDGASVVTVVTPIRLIQMHILGIKWLAPKARSVYVLGDIALTIRNYSVVQLLVPRVEFATSVGSLWMRSVDTSVNPVAFRLTVANIVLRTEGHSVVDLNATAGAGNAPSCAYAVVMSVVCTGTVAFNFTATNVSTDVALSSTLRVVECSTPIMSSIAGETVVGGKFQVDRCQTTLRSNSSLQSLNRAAGSRLFGEPIARMMAVTCNHLSVSSNSKFGIDVAVTNVNCSLQDGSRVDCQHNYYINVASVVATFLDGPVTARFANVTLFVDAATLNVTGLTSTNIGVLSCLYGRDKSERGSTLAVASNVTIVATNAAVIQVKSITSTAVVRVMSIGTVDRSQYSPLEALLSMLVAWTVVRISAGASVTISADHGVIFVATIGLLTSQASAPVPGQSTVTVAYTVLAVDTGSNVTASTAVGWFALFSVVGGLAGAPACNTSLTVVVVQISISDRSAVAASSAVSGGGAIGSVLCDGCVGSGADDAEQPSFPCGTGGDTERVPPRWGGTCISNVSVSVTNQSQALLNVLASAPFSDRPTSVGWSLHGFSVIAGGAVSLANWTATVDGASSVVAAQVASAFSLSRCRVFWLTVLTVGVGGALEGLQPSLQPIQGDLRDIAVRVAGGSQVAASSINVASFVSAATLSFRFNASMSVLLADASLVVEDRSTLNVTATVPGITAQGLAVVSFGANRSGSNPVSVALDLVGVTMRVTSATVLVSTAGRYSSTNQVCMALPVAAVPTVVAGVSFHHGGIDTGGFSAAFRTTLNRVVMLAEGRDALVGFQAKQAKTQPVWASLSQLPVEAYASSVMSIDVNHTTATNSSHDMVSVVNLSSVSSVLRGSARLEAADVDAWCVSIRITHSGNVSSRHVVPFVPEGTAPAPLSVSNVTIGISNVLLSVSNGSSVKAASQDAQLGHVGAAHLLSVGVFAAPPVAGAVAFALNVQRIVLVLLNSTAAVTALAPRADVWAMVVLVVCGTPGGRAPNGAWTLDVAPFIALDDVVVCMVNAELSVIANATASGAAVALAVGAGALEPNGTHQLMLPVAVPSARVPCRPLTDHRGVRRRALRVIASQSRIAVRGPRTVAVMAQVSAIDDVALQRRSALALLSTTLVGGAVVAPLDCILLRLAPWGNRSDDDPSGNGPAGAEPSYVLRDADMIVSNTSITGGTTQSAGRSDALGFGALQPSQGAAAFWTAVISSSHLRVLVCDAAVSIGSLPGEASLPAPSPSPATAAPLPSSTPSQPDTAPRVIAILANSSTVVEEGPDDAEDGSLTAVRVDLTARGARCVTIPWGYATVLHSRMTCASVGWLPVNRSADRRSAIAYNTTPVDIDGVETVTNGSDPRIQLFGRPLGDAGGCLDLVPVELLQDVRNVSLTGVVPPVASKMSPLTISVLSDVTEAPDTSNNGSSIGMFTTQSNSHSEKGTSPGETGTTTSFAPRSEAVRATATSTAASASITAISNTSVATIQNVTTSTSAEAIVTAMARPPTTAVTDFPMVASATEVAAVAAQPSTGYAIGAAAAATAVSSVAAAPGDAMQSMRVLSALRVIRYACAGGNETPPSVHRQRQDAAMPFPRSLLPGVAVLGDVALAAVLANLGAVAACAAATFAFARRSSAAETNGGSFARPPAAWERSRFPALAIVVALYLVDGTTFATVLAMLRAPSEDQSVEARWLIASLGAVSCLLLVSAAVVVVVKNPLSFAADSPSPSRVGIVAVLLRRRGQWTARVEGDVQGMEQATRTSASDAAGRIEPALPQDDDGEQPGPGAYLGAYRPLLASARGGPGVAARMATYGVAIDAALTIAAAANEGWAAATCAAPIVLDVGIAIATVAAVYLFVVAPHPSPVKAVLAATNGALALAVATLGRMSVVAEDPARGIALAENAVRVALASTAVSGASVAVGVAAWWLRRREDRLLEEDNVNAEPTELPSLNEHRDATAMPLLSPPSLAIHASSPFVNPLLSQNTSR